MGTLEITMFGTLRVQHPGRPVLQFPTRRVKDLFSYLLINRHTIHSREALAELLWGDANERNPRHCLNTALWRLNRVLGEPDPGEHPYLRVDAQHIGFNTASDCRLDVAEFENRCLWAEQLGAQSAEQQASFYHQAIDLYQADLLVDCYGEWCLIERERLQRIYLDALEFLVDHHAARDEYKEATDCAARLLACDPMREDLHRKLIEFYLATFQPAAALRQYQECEEVLRRELGTAPAPETRAAVQRVFRQTPATSPSPIQLDSRARGTSYAVARAASLTSPAPPAGADAAGQLAGALSHLQEAMAVFDNAQAELRAAAASVETLARELAAATAATDGRRLQPGEVAVSAQIHRVATLIAQKASDVERAAAPAPTA